MTRADVHDTLRLASRELEQIFDELDRSGAEAPLSAERKLRRWKFGGTRALITFVDRHGAAKHFIVAPRNLSAGGIGILHGGFLHPGSDCTVTLKSVRGGTRVIKGVVRRCRHIRGHLHEIGIQFEEHVDAREFIRFGDEHIFNLENVDPSTLSGSILYVEDSKADQRLFAHHFRGSQVDLLFADSGETALAMLCESPRIVIVDDDLPDMRGIDLIAEIRKSGFSEPVLMLTANGDPELRMNAKCAGAAELLVKPCSAALLHQAVAEYLQSPTAGHDNSDWGPIVSSAADLGVDFDMINAAADELKELGQQIEQAIGGSDFEALKRLAIKARGTAEGYGFERLAHTAEDLSSFAEDAARRASALNAAKRLRDQCRRVKAVK
jgi:CheY-like chemotaxis protein